MLAHINLDTSYINNTQKKFYHYTHLQGCTLGDLTTTFTVENFHYYQKLSLLLYATISESTPPPRICPPFLQLHAKLPQSTPPSQNTSPFLQLGLYVKHPESPESTPIQVEIP